MIRVFAWEEMILKTSMQYNKNHKTKGIVLNYHIFKLLLVMFPTILIYNDLYFAYVLIRLWDRVVLN